MHRCLVPSTNLAAIAVIAALLVACGGRSTAPSEGAAATGNVEPSGAADRTDSQPETSLSAVASPMGEASSAIVEAPFDPVNVDVVLDAAKLVEALIPVEGGAVSTTGADGTVFTLEIPTDALMAETTIGLTPVASISGMPFGGDRPYAVQLSPDGLFLQNFATLTIAPAEDIPADHQIVFGYLHDGKDVILAAPVVASSEIKINVLHFSGNGVTSGTTADLDPLRERLGGSAERRMESIISERVAIERQRQLLGRSDGEDTGDITELLRQYEEQVVNPRVAAAGESCAAGKLAQETVIAYERQRQLLGMSDGNGPDRYPGLFDKVARTCVLEEFAACVEHHRIFLMLPIYLSLLRQNSRIPTYSPGTIAEARDLTIKCLTFKLQFASTGELDAGSGGYTSTVTSDLTLRFHPEEFSIDGMADLVNTDFDFRMPCPATNIPGGDVFVVFKLSYEVEGGEPDEDGNYPDAAVSDMRLVFMPGVTTESAIVHACKDMGEYTVPPFAAWTQTWIANHIGDFDATESGYLATDWEMSGGDLFAEKEWSRAEGPVSEEGTFKLYHTPGG